MSERTNVFQYLKYLEPEERFYNMCDVMKFWSFGGSTISRVQDKLKTIVLNSR